MCILCQAQQGTGFPQFAASVGSGHIQYGAGAVATSGGTGSTNTDALISGYKWAGSALTFAFPAVATALPGYDTTYDETGTFTAVTGTLATGIRMAMAHIGDYTGLTITETANTSTANMLIGRTGQTTTAHAYLPDGYFKGGDVWFGTSEDFDSPLRGNYAYSTALHEIGHALGLKHGHTFIGGVDIYEDDVGIIGAPIAANRDSLEFTIMTYRSHIGQDLAVFDYYTNENASFPQTLMMYDIAALQKMYGADFNTNATNTVYTFSATTGEMSVNGVAEGALAGNRIFRTVWDGNGTDTYDFSNFGSNQTIDLAPGGWSLISSGQRADLGSGNFARGNVFNALQFGADVRSLIENAIGGTGNDTILGNIAANTLTGGAGNDLLSGGAGNDTFVFNAGLDTITDFTAGGTEDRIDISALSAFPAMDLVMNIATQAGADVVITFAFNTILTLQNTTFAALTTQDFILAAAGSFNAIVDTASANSLAGTPGVDSISGNGGNDTLSGLAGNDTVLGGDGADYLFGDGNNDVLDGGADNDILLGGTGDDSVIGGSGIDYVFGGTGSNVLSGNAGLDILISEGSSDVMNGGADQNYYYRLANGASQVFGGDGLDILVGGTFASDDFFNGFGGGDFALGGGGNDELNGGGGDDTLLGEAGNDTLDGGLGFNYLYAEGIGNDLIRVNTALGGTQTHVISAFEGGGATDTMQISGSTLTNFAGYQALLAGVGTVVGGNLLQNTGVGAVLTLNLGTTNQTDIWFLGVGAYGLTAADFQFI